MEDAVLVGHSYGGMVIAGVADRVPAEGGFTGVLDALVPRDSESCWTLINDERARSGTLDVDDTGYGVRPLAFFDSRSTAHPLASFLQRIRLRRRSGPVPASRLRLRAEVAWKFTAAAVIRTGS